MIRSSIGAVKNELRRNYEVINILENIGLEESDGTLDKYKKEGQLYYRRKTVKNGVAQVEYLGKADSEKVLQYYKERFLKILYDIVKKNIASMETFLKNYIPVTRETVYKRLPKTVSELGDYVFLDEQVDALWEWAKEEYETNDMPKKYPRETVNGSEVRSVGECGVYNACYLAPLPFRYECALVVEDDLGELRVIYPDFMFKCLDGTIIILEFMGLLKDPKYGSDQAARLRWLQKAGFVLGSNLFLVGTGVDGTIDTEAINDLVEYLKERIYRIPAA